MIKTPIGKELIINAGGSPVTNQKMLIEEDIALSLSSTFNPLLGGGNSKLLTIAGSLSRELTGRGFSGQFKQMGMQLWESTQPISTKITVGFYINKEKPDAKIQVYDPTMALCKLPLPEDQAGGNLIPPGPTILSALTESPKGKAGQIISVQIGKILYIKSAIVKGAEPVFSNETDENDYPIWSKVSLDIISVMTATKSLLDNRGV